MFTLNRSLATRIPPLVAGFSRQGGFKYYSGHTHESVRNFPESLSEENRNHCPKLSGIAVRSSPDFPSKWKFRLGIIIQLSFVLINCGVNVEDPSRPSPPIWIQKSLPEEWPERGIDAHESNGIFLEWEPDPNEDIRTYYIHRATWYDDMDSLGNYVRIAHLELETFDAYEYIDRLVEPGITYYYKLISEDVSGYTSRFSDSLAYTLMQRIGAELMNPNGVLEQLNDNRILSWQPTYGMEIENYCLTITTEENELVSRSLFLPGNYVGGTESWAIPASIELISQNIYQWRIDVGSRYIDGFETAGSESRWAKFVCGGE